ncbi:hypothetical protein CHARACLAT_006080 [Characodon lateralis]|uniref:Uncharacterized protein n=1 Tax=Characodon lateralis TaxID=208331 RepID=A0ABU7CV81_9TELE|nr:hypothetical protein [Characodon lateralis]
MVMLEVMKLCFHIIASRWHPLIHPSIFYTRFFHGELVPISSSQQARGGVHPRQVTSQSKDNTEIQDKQPCMHSFTPKGNLERPINLTVMFLDCVRKPEYPERHS